MSADTTERLRVTPVLYRCKPCRRTVRRFVWVRTSSCRWFSASVQRMASSTTRTVYDADGRHVYTDDGRFALPVPMVDCQCGRQMKQTPVRGRYVADIPCTAKCVAAVGPSCDCSCGGKNHGGAHDAADAALLGVA